MAPGDLTTKILQEIRDELRTQGERTEKGFAQMDQRFQVVETTLRDLAEPMVMLARGIKSALEVRGGLDKRLDEHEQRLAEIEKRLPH